MKNIFHKTLLSFLLIGFVSVSSAYVTVGGFGCDYDNLEDAYNDGDFDIRVTTEQVYTDVFTISESRNIVGGYQNCTLADAGIQGGGYSRWQGTLNADPATNVAVVTVNSQSNALVFMDRFDIFGADTRENLGDPGGVLVTGNAFLSISNSYVQSNQGNWGGGIQVNGVNARTYIFNTRIKDNSSDSDGGGVLCVNSGTFSLVGDSNIKSNTSSARGGGLYANSGCQATIFSGDTNVVDLFGGTGPEFGIISNTAAEQGGGIYIGAGADVELTGNADHPASVITNISNYDPLLFSYGGGGVYVTGTGSTFTSTNGRIEFNIAIDGGAGFVVNDGGSFTMKRADGDCWDNFNCSRLAYNYVSSSTGTGGAGYLFSGGSTADISRTHIDTNIANGTAVITANFSSSLTMEGNVINGNGPKDQPFASQLFLINGAGGDAADFHFRYNTISGNNADTMFKNSGNDTQNVILISNSIIWDQGNTLLITGNTEPVLSMDCMDLHELRSQLPDNTATMTFTHIFKFDPLFIDSANADYRLQSNSAAIDMCDEFYVWSKSQYKDFDDKSRGYNYPSAQNYLGPYDPGAYEFYPSDLIFQSSFD